jgi:hypothetical protein
MDTEWVRLIVSVLSGLAAAIPLVVQLVKYVQRAIKEKNWPQVVNLVMGYMERAEAMFEEGADRKEWVLAMVKASADTIKYEIDMDEISALIDSLCDMSKVVNNSVGVKTK